ncbi:uncharacterized protein EI90DRAFT_3071477 [Cantharellus anzutake]|uniref:uncharacterized protein n=1 Tax=Cantharellus anzutake TaxID=1750568 RepID=UPI0019056B28|nr:uncharacterized protein EI90DRAFT_3071477 [Cantharellus anzutake]KAF8326094.1 hypothetical protein EI90DRAFT_3071477 [Cantharellus anzutake]
MTSRKVYPVHTIFRHEKLGSNRAIPISDVRLYWVRNGATASLEDVDDQPLYTDEKELPESTACAQGLVDVPIHWISPAGREILFNDNVLSRWTIKETSGLRLYVSFRYWIFHFRDDRHGSEDSLILHSRECYPDFQVRKYRVMNMEINTLYASLPCLNRAEIFSAIKNVCLRTRDDDINRTPKWLIDEAGAFHFIPHQTTFNALIVV